MTLQTQENNKYLTLGAHTNGDAFLFSSNSILFGTKEIDRMEIDSLGNVFIGTPLSVSYSKFNVSSDKVGGLFRLNQETSTFGSEISFFVEENFKWSLGAAADGYSAGESFYVHNEDRVKVDFLIDGDNGKIGIGTNAPSTNLHVYDTTASLRVQSTKTPSWAAVNLKTPTSSFSLISGFDTAGFAIKDINANIHRFVIDSIGNIGIGNKYPTSKLHILEDANVSMLTLDHSVANQYSAIDFSNSGTKYWSIGTSTSANAIGESFGIYNYGRTSRDFFIDGDNGNVGIGNTAPSNKLDVSGDIMANDNNFLIVDSAGNNIEFSGSGNATYASYGAYIRATTKPPSGGSLFRVLSQGGAERFRVEHG
jgi:hypothetical protein